MSPSGPEGDLLFQILGLKACDSGPGKQDQPWDCTLLDMQVNWQVITDTWENALHKDPPLTLPIIASFRLDSTGKMFFSTSSMGPGLCAIFSFRSSASLALFSFSCLACKEGSAEVSVWGKVNKIASIQQWSTHTLQKYFNSIRKGNCR